jgi:hypothetical protein
VEALGLKSNEFTFEVDFAGGYLTLTANENSLEFLTSTEVTFTVSYKGKALASGTSVGLVFNQSQLGGLGTTAVLGTGGSFTVTGLKALVIDGPIQVVASFVGLNSNNASFSVFYSQGDLKFTAQPSELELFVATPTTFSFTYKGTALPAGATVGFTADSRYLDKLPSTSETGQGGKIIAQELTAITPNGPIKVKGTVSGHLAGEVDLQVKILKAGLGLHMVVTPDISSEFSNLPPEEGPYTKSCLLFDVSLTVSYRGRALPQTEVYIDGFALSPTGFLDTDQNGAIAATIQYSRSDEGEYQSTGHVYTLSLNEVTQYFEGPKAKVFTECGF